MRAGSAGGECGHACVRAWTAAVLRQWQRQRKVPCGTRLCQPHQTRNPSTPTWMLMMLRQLLGVAHVQFVSEELCESR
jgi:hypothetical protein